MNAWEKIVLTEIRRGERDKKTLDKQGNYVIKEYNSYIQHVKQQDVNQNRGNLYKRRNLPREKIGGSTNNNNDRTTKTRNFTAEWMHKKEILNAKKIEMHRSVWTAVIRIGIKTKRTFHNKYTFCSFFGFL